MQEDFNPQLKLAFEYVCFTNKCIYLTGKAGTGKTTFLHRIKDNPPKRLAVVAPTGVAAINAGGMTIHSLFQLPFGPLIPGQSKDAERQRRFTRKKIKLIQSLDLLIIDEVSMVRADLLDGIDEVLRRYKRSTLAFGGVQLLMIGDLHQLPPVVKDHEWDLLRQHYETPYFFSSLALKRTQAVTIELTQIYRQSDNIFIELLNKVRNNQMDEAVLSTLNSRYLPIEEIPDTEDYITLSSHNATADKINAQKLASLSNTSYKFKAEISGDFPPHAYPAGERLELKKGAQVMFVKNDTSPDKLYYNGKIGKVIFISSNEIRVQCQGDDDPISVSTVEWSNTKYQLNEQTKEVEEDIIGSFTQYPLRLAWAITIHKSQGLTFEKVILDAQSAFAHGQVYVALSRCKSFEGIILRSPIKYSSVRTDSKIRNFSKEVERNAPDETQLNQAKIAFQQMLIWELFDFSELRKILDRMNRILLEFEDKFVHAPLEAFREMVRQAGEGIFPVEEKFKRHLQQLYRAGGLPEENEQIQERVKKGGKWFLTEVESKLIAPTRSLTLETDNAQVKKQAVSAFEQLLLELSIKEAAFKTLEQGFSAKIYQRVKADTTIDKQRPAVAKMKLSAPPKDIKHPELYQLLTVWRNETADEKGVARYIVLPTRSLVELVEHLPSTNKQLLDLYALGKGRVKQYGEAIIAIIKQYCKEQNIPLREDSNEPIPEKKPKKSSTKSISFGLFQAGKSVAEIAEERELVPGTIESHLSHFIKTGDIDIAELMTANDVEQISTYIKSLGEEYSLTKVKGHFGDTFTFGQLRMVTTHLARQNKGEED